MRTLEELKACLVIDREHLEDELVKQPQLYWEVSEQFVVATEKKDIAKHISENMAANLKAQFREGSIEKVTDKKADDFVDASPAYVEQYKFYLKYKAEADMWGALKDAFFQRSSMLRDLVSMFQQNYWGSSVGAPSNMIETYGEKYRKNREKTE